MNTQVWQYGVGIWVESPNFERAAHWVRVRPSDDHFQRDLRLHRVLRVAVGTSVALSVNPDDSLCGFDLEYRCRIVRITAASGGTVTADVQPESAATRCGLALANTVLPYLSSTHLTFHIQTGGEVVVMILVDATTEVSDRLVLATQFEFGTE